MGNIIYLITSILLFLIFIKTTEESPDLIQDEYTTVMTSKATAFHVMNYFQVDQLKGNYVTLVSSCMALVISIAILATKKKVLGIFLVIVSTLIFHIAFLTFQTSEHAFPISSIIDFTLQLVKKPIEQLPKTLLGYFTVLSSVFPKTQQIFQMWIFNLENTSFPPALLILIACGLLHKKLQLATLLIVPTVISVIIGIPILVLNVSGNVIEQVLYFVCALFFIVFFVNGALQMEKIFLTPLFFISTVLCSKSVVNVTRDFIVLSSMQRDCIFVGVYLVLFWLVFLKRFAYSFVPAFLVFCSVELIVGTNIQIGALIPVFFLLHGLFD
ncbi:hypothetical protein EIN_054550 [Entamoeba invadens IP1]|uniref:hypothetical protein n=1 Tax=Entamoeba invadens IP1 TaxID=370355 RepID=UPI0002C3D4D8|nr:hypothetical protein EIN_054550 [Entamoeba invadens IP1]ELP93170.1 hypothetical protein EIN_054550 [Entamoeba invadens IP1]|eukprot:XP_004259941.1 hypothetical protein EIN_054550 [Entamoeba invadens IP1]